MKRVSPRSISPIHSPAHSSLKLYPPSCTEDLDLEVLQQMTSHDRSHIRLMNVDAEKTSGFTFGVREAGDVTSH